jgi:hypothetical protein
MPRLLAVAAASLLLLVARDSLAHIEAHYTLGRVVSESSNVLVVEVARVNRDKNLVIYKKVRDLKGKHAGDEVKQNIGQRGGPGDAKLIMDWAQEGKQAVLFYNSTGSLTCTGPFWYQAFQEGEWWAMSHAELYMTRTYFGEVDKLFPALDDLLAGKEVVISCLADGPRESLQKRSGKVQTMKAALKRHDYNPKRDVVETLGDASEFLAAASGRETKVLLAQGSGDWKMMAAAKVKVPEAQWRGEKFDDKQWSTVKTPAGYGEPEIESRKGTVIKEKGEAMLFRKAIEIPADLLARKDVRFELRVASDDSAAVSVNGKVVADEPGVDHEFAYWNQTVGLPANAFQPGRNVIAVLVRNKSGSSDLYLDLELAAEYPRDEKK